VREEANEYRDVLGSCRLVAAAAPQVDRRIFVALLPWALLGLPKCFGALDCYEDCILFASGVYGLIVLIRNWKMLPSSIARAALR
jgi:hypothetical protein